MTLKYAPIPDGTDAAALLRQFAPVLDLNAGPWIAGGSVLRMMMGLQMDGSDIDVFSRNSAQKLAVADWLSTQTAKDRVYNVSHSDNSAFVFHDKIVQLIPQRYFADSISELFMSFDYTVCQFATDGRVVVYTEEALADARARVIRKIDGGLPSRIPLYRLMKYSSKGYRHTPGMLRDALNLQDENVKVSISNDSIMVLHDY